MKRCPTCSAICGADDVFCEADGTRLDPSASPPNGGSISVATGPESAANARTGCARCGSVEADDGYCRGCGHRLDASSSSAVLATPPQPVPAVFRATDMAARLGHQQRDETNGSIGAVCDQGLTSAHNEDAFAVAHGVSAGERWWVMVVCDGISSASFSDRCAQISAEVARDELVRFASEGDLGQGVAAAISRSIQKAHAASCSITERQPGKDEPGTTIVVAFVFRQRVTVGWAGDSRAYWVTRLAAEPLTKDHSWAVETIEHGEMTEREAMANPLAHAITRCIGPLENSSPTADVQPSIKSRSIAGHGQVVLCSDGLWNYLERDDELSTLLQSVAHLSPIDRARSLVAHALTRGGRDNVTVVIADV